MTTPRIPSDEEVNAFVGLCLLFVSENWKAFLHWMNDPDVTEAQLQSMMADAMMTTQLARVAREVFEDE